jgi:hypothetical protein
MKELNKLLGQFEFSPKEIRKIHQNNSQSVETTNGAKSLVQCRAHNTKTAMSETIKTEQEVNEIKQSGFQSATLKHCFPNLQLILDLYGKF